MNKLSLDKQCSIISALTEGNSIRSTERMTSTHRDTIMRLLVRVGNGCERLHDERLQRLGCHKIQIDEIWSYVGKKQKNLTPQDDPSRTGNMWTFVAIDSDTKLIPAYKIGRRDLATAKSFLNDLSSRLTNRVQLSSDSLKAYVEATEAAFGSDIDYGQIVKSYEAEPSGSGRYSPPKVVRADKKFISGNPNAADISTSHIERQNLTMRMSMRRFTRLTNAFSKKLENLKAAVALHFAHYNFVRIHKSLRVTPDMQANITNKLWTIEDLLKIQKHRL